MAAVYFGSSDADKACDALVSDLLKDEEEAGETDVPEERSGEVTLMAESEEERRSPSGPPGLILSTVSSAVNSLSSPSYFEGSQFRRNLNLSLQDECLDEGELDNDFSGGVGEATAPESFEMFYPPVVAPPLGPGPDYDRWLAQLPSIGSANHFNGTCDRCCFHPKGRCHNGYNCQHCHYDHEKRKRKSKKKSTERMGMTGMIEMDARSMSSLPHTPHGPLGPLMPPLGLAPYPLPPAPFPMPEAHLAPPGPPGLQTCPWYEPGLAPPPDYLPLDATSPEPSMPTPPPAWEDYVGRLEEENRYLRSMLMQCLGPSATLPPSVIPSHRLHAMESLQPPPPAGLPGPEYANRIDTPAMSPGAIPFCPQGWDATRDFQVVP